MNKIQQIQVKSKNFIAEGKVAEALSLLREIVISERPGFENMVTILSHRYSTIHRNKILNFLSYEKLDIEESKLIWEILEMIDQLDLDTPNLKLGENFYYYLGVFFRVGQKVIGIILIFLAIIAYVANGKAFHSIVNPNIEMKLKPIIMPTLMLIVGVYIFMFKHKKNKK